MIENQYQFDRVTDSGTELYGYELRKDNRYKYRVATKWGSWKNGEWLLEFNKQENVFDQYGEYENIVNSLKNECSYFDIITYMENDYVAYKCDKEGSFGFMIKDNTACIRYFPSKM